MWVRHLSHNDGMVSRPVKVLVDHDQPETASSSLGQSSISVQGITVETHKVELRELLGRLPKSLWDAGYGPETNSHQTGYK